MSDLSKIKLNGTVYNFKDAVARTPYYGVCSTAKGTAQKTVTISNIETLTDGLSIFVKFTATNTAENPTLKINNLDPVAIKRYGTTAASTSTASSWNAGAVVQLIYDGTNFIMENFNNTTYSAMTEAEMQTGTATTARNITAARLKQAIEYHAPVLTVNGDTGAITIDEIQTTAGENNVEYDLIGTAPANTNSGLVPLYKPTLLTFAKTTDYGRLTLGSSDTPGVLRIYSSTTNASGYTDLKTGSSSTNTRTITFPDATGTVALTSDIPNVPSWALAANKPTYTAAEVGATTSSDVSGMISSAVSGITSFSMEVVSSLPATGVAGRIYFVTGNNNTNDIYEEYIYVNNNWEKLGNFDATNVDLSGYLQTGDIAAWAKAANKPSYTASEVGALPSNTTYVSSFNGESGAITYIPPVTSVNGQTGAVTIAADDKTWNGVTLNKAADTFSGTNPIYVTAMTAGSSTTAKLLPVRSSPTANNVARYDANAYLNSTTPTSGDSSTKVATTAFVGTAIAAITASDVGALADDSVAAGITSTDISNWNAKLSSFTETDPTVPSWAKASSKPTYTASEVGAVPTTGGTLTGTLTVNAAGANTNGNIVFQNHNADFGATTTLQQTTMTVQSEAMGYLLINGRAAINQTPTFDTAIVNKQYVDNKFSSISVPQPYNATTNPTGYLRITDLPIYDGTVV